jgi:tol-pal system protein YbgF
VFGACSGERAPLLVTTGKVPSVILSASKWRKRLRLAFALSAALLIVSLPAAQAVAQQSPPQPEQGSLSPSAPTAKAQGGDSVGARIGRIEDKIGDLQVLVGTLESFIRAKPGATLPVETAAAPSAPQGQPADSDLGPRVDALETQITALTSQLERIGQQMTALEAKLSAAPAPLAPLPPSAAPPQRQGQAPEPSSDAALASAAGGTSQPRWYGPKPANGQQAGAAGQESPQALLPPSPAAADSQSLAAALPSSDAQALYEQGYGAVLQRDYAGAEAAFRQLLASYPDDALAGNAQYWIGETYYMRGDYKNAADAFLKGYKKHKSGDKAPDTLLRLAMSLAALGQKDAACSTFGELKAKFPTAPDQIRDEANSERQKAGC